MQQLAEEISHEYYRKLGLQLGLSDAKLSNIEHDNGSAEAFTYAALKEWFKTVRGRNARKKLVEALQKCGLRHQARKIMDGKECQDGRALGQ